MAFVDNTTFTGIDSDKFYSAALLSGNTRKLFSQLAGVKSAIKVPRFDFTQLVQIGDADAWTAGGTATLSQKSLSVCPMFINFPLNESTLNNNFISFKMKQGANVADFCPNEFGNYLLNLMAENVSAQLESYTWTGSTSTDCPGILKQLVADGLTSLGTTAGLTAANILAQMQTVYLGIPDAVRQAGEIEGGDLRIFMNTGDAATYKVALSTATTGLPVLQDGTELRYMNIPIITSGNIPAGNIVACRLSNLWLAIDTPEDDTEIKVVAMKDLAMGNHIRFVMNFKHGVTYGVKEEIAWRRNFSNV